MIFASWNVNSARMREDRMLRWLSTRQPDVVCIQELKCTNEDFPVDKVRDLGYHAELHGQKTYNGVAILSRSEPTDVIRGMGHKDLDEEARFIAASIDGVRIVNTYVPAGGEDAKSPKYSQKLKWLRALINLLKEKNWHADSMVLCGDLNIAPEERDVALPEKWRGSAVFNPELTAIYEELIGLGLSDSFRQHNKDAGIYTWWDYNDLCYQRNEGLRIDHILIPGTHEDRCYRCWVDWEERQGSKPSDHAPLMADFDWAQLRSRDMQSVAASGAVRRGRSFIAPADVSFGEDAARLFVRDMFPEMASNISDESLIRIRFASGFEEVLRWNYFPAGARAWTVDGVEWFEMEGS